MRKFLRDVLCNNFSGSLILQLYPTRIPDIRWKPYRFVVERKGVSKKIPAMLFWGFYESAEIRFIHKYYKGDSDVVELGGSMGIVSSHLASLQNRGRKLVIVEANPALINTLTENVNAYKKSENTIKVYNKAISYSGEEVVLSITEDSTETAISKTPSTGNVIKVQPITLHELVSENNLSDYTLVCDIEGAEAEILNEENGAVRSCKHLFLELHDTNYKGQNYTVDDLVSLIITKFGFQQVDQYGPVFYFTRK